ncbi:DNA polymerase I [Candidatus Nanosyncoccus alces]|uniref:DNA-directed DNA polymerase n=1 Tax=Candidatus Nanosyncoccus alces TaxID=2171997 RepID=A0ABY0FLG8_9BACT|nr:DNA polymerase I [Candidatus Nanosyncoccus alces]RYC74622.1 DNA polymerase I, thermostable [Candidatus Nanosyncoccus alces]
MKRLVLIDGKSVFYRGYYAMGPLSLSDGTPTGGIYGFAAIAMEIVKKLNPTKVIVAWDSKTSVSRRRAIYPEYKAGRTKPGDDFYAQIPLLEELISNLGWTFVEIDDYEADDIIGTLSRQADETLDSSGKCEYETYIISSDLDMLQIVDDNTYMWRILKGFSNIEQINVAEVEEKYGIKKSQFLDLKSLKGDSSDNIPGVPGIGEKTAAKLLNEYNDLDNIYNNLDKITGSVHDKLKAGKESAYMSRDLAKIMFDAPVSLAKIPDFRFDRDQVIAGLKKLEFNSLIRKIQKLDSISRKTQVGVQKTVSRESHEASEVSEAHNDGPEQTRSNEPQMSFPIDEKDIIIGWDIKSIMHSNDKIVAEILSGKPFWDLSQAAFLLNPLSREQPTLSIPEEEYQKQKAELEKYPRLYNIYTDFDLPLIPVLYKMEQKGMLIDRTYFSNLRAEYSAEVDRIEHEIFALAGKEFNLNSPYQLGEILFVNLQLPVKGIKKTARGYSTGAKELEKLKDFHPIIAKIIEYREAAKLLSTYIIPMPDLADASDRIHTTFTQNVTATGRLSSQNPNLQNIPVRTEEGKRIRTGFIAPAGKVLVSADYSQFELRLAAILAGDQALISDFNSGIDIHTKTASEAFNVPFDQVTKNQRRAAKVINFGVLYGMSVKGLADAAKMSIADAKQFINNYFELRAPIKRKLESILKQAREQGYVETFYGRRRPTPDVKSANFLVRQAAERAAQNMPIQGTEADLMKRAMINVDRALPAGAELVMQVHDSLIVECDENISKDVAKILKHEMESVAPELAIKLAVDVTTGHNWGEL